jgi:CheY-like chemotaxis protein
MKRVMVVDDSTILRDQLTGLLQKFGYDTIAAGNGQEALELLDESPDVDLAIIDIVMPVMDGKELITRLRASDKHNDLPLLVLTAAENLELVTECLDAGADDFLIKPLNPRLMFQRVQGLVESTPRAYNRVPCNVLAEVSPGGGDVVSGVITELGEGGVGVILEEEMDKGDLVKITFALPAHPEPMNLGAEVVFVQDVNEGILHGLRFVIIDRESRGRIMAFVQETV